MSPIQVEKLGPSLILRPEMGSTGRNWVGYRSLGVSGGVQEVFIRVKHGLVKNDQRVNTTENVSKMS